MRSFGPYRPWTAEEDAKLGVVRDEELARQIGRSVLAVRTRRQRRRLALRKPLRRPWTPEQEKLLGTATDNEVALLLGRDRATVFDHRQLLGIPHYQGRSREWTLTE